MDNKCEETREQTLRKIEFFVPKLTDQELRLVAGFIKGVSKTTHT